MSGLRTFFQLYYSMPPDRLPLNILHKIILIFPTAALCSLCILDLLFFCFCIIHLNSTKKTCFNLTVSFFSTSASSSPSHLYTSDLLICPIYRVLYLQIGGILPHYSDRSLSSITFFIFSTKYLNTDNIDENLLNKREPKPHFFYYFAYSDSDLWWANMPKRWDPKDGKKIKQLTVFLILLHVTNLCPFKNNYKEFSPLFLQTYLFMYLVFLFIYFLEQR